MLTLKQAGHIAFLFAGFSLAVQGAESAPKKTAPAKPAQPDIKFLEYLGTVDGDEDNWTDTLSEVSAAKPQEKVNAKVATPSSGPKPVVESK